MVSMSKRLPGKACVGLVPCIFSSVQSSCEHAHSMKTQSLINISSTDKYLQKTMEHLGYGQGQIPVFSKPNNRVMQRKHQKCLRYAMNERSYETQATPNAEREGKTLSQCPLPQRHCLGATAPPLSVQYPFQLQTEDKYPIEISSARCFDTLTVFVYLRFSSKLHFLLAKPFFFKDF